MMTGTFTGTSYRNNAPLPTVSVNRPGESGDSEPWEGWSHVKKYVEEVGA
jgi:hypothetical protein